MSFLDVSARVIMPPPISANNLYRNVSAKEKAHFAHRKNSSRVKTQDYLKWLRLAAETLNVQRPLPRFFGPVELTYFVGEIDVGQMDFGNTEKAITDSLVNAEVIVDDKRKWVRYGGIFWTPAMRGTLVVIEPAGEPPNAADLIATVPKHLRGLLR